jgi:hypothetical protein
MSEDRCPFCGAEPFWSQRQTTEYQCRILITGTGLAPTRGKECLEAELASAKGLLRELRQLATDCMQCNHWSFAKAGELTDRVDKFLTPTSEAGPEV